MEEKNKRRFLPPDVFIFFLALFFLLLAFLFFFRFIFLIRNLGVAKDVPFVVLLKAILVGTRFDAAVLSYILIPFYVFGSFPYIGLQTGRFRRAIFYILMNLVFAFLFFLLLVDIEFYREFGSRLNLFAIEYLDKFDIVVDMIWKTYPVWAYLVFFAALFTLFLVFFIRINKIAFQKYRGGGTLSRVLYFIIGSALLFLGARGRIGLAPLDWGAAYFSRFNFASQVALNGPYTLGWSILREKKENDPKWLAKFEFLPLSDAIKLTSAMVTTKLDSFIEPEKSLKRYTNPACTVKLGFKPNIIVILLESWQAKLVGAYGCTLDLTPNFDSLAQDGLLFENMYATGIRTNRGLVSTLCSFPSQTGLTIMKKLNAKRPFISLPMLLSQRGYESILIYGGDLKFDNIDGFFRTEGVNKFIGKDDFHPSEYLGKWGVPDHIVFERANREFAKLKSKPFLGIIITLSNHPPYLLPDSSFMKFGPIVKNYKELNSFYYSDWAIGHFFKLAKDENYFKKTIFVLLGDHGKKEENMDDMSPERFKIAALIYAPEILKGIAPMRISSTTSQTDILPTLMSLLGEPYIHESWGHDIFALDSLDSGFAIIIDAEKIGYIRPPFYFLEHIGARYSLFNLTIDPYLKNDISDIEQEITEKYRTEARAYLQASIFLTKQTLIGKK